MKYNIRLSVLYLYKYVKKKLKYYIKKKKPYVRTCNKFEV